MIRQPPRGATRSERKMFIAAERKRHADLGLEEEKKCLGQELKMVAKEIRMLANILEDKGEALVGDQ